ncbi:MAG: hypothetical protein QM747_18670 [Nocardioides sp.]
MTVSDNLIVGVLVLGFILWRQLQPRAVREDQPYRLMLVLGVIGVVDLVGFAGSHRVTPVAWALLAVSLGIGAAFGVTRGALVHIWRRDGVLVRQGNAVTAMLWIAGLVVHVLVDVLINGVDHAASGIGADAILLYLGVALAAQRYMTLNRAERLAVA